MPTAKSFFILVILSVLRIFDTVTSQVHSVPQIPSIVKEAFEHKYLKAIQVDWVKRDSSYRAYFKFEKDKSNYFAKFSDKGKWLEFSREYEVIYSDLPEAVKKMMLQAPDYKPKSLTKVEVAGGSIYYLLVMSKGHLDWCIKYSGEGFVLGSWD